jgi:hypothetical protein
MANIPNPLPLPDNFVRRYLVGDMLVIRPILPRPNELRIFYSHAMDAGFRPGREVFWGPDQAPAFYYRPISPERQRDWKAMKSFQDLARFHEEVHPAEEFEQRMEQHTIMIGDDAIYTVMVNEKARTLDLYRKNDGDRDINTIWVETAYY